MRNIPSMIQKIITLRIYFVVKSSKHIIPLLKNSTELQKCQMELHFLTCASVYKLEEDIHFLE